MGFVIYQICKYKMVLFYFWLGKDMRDGILNIFLTTIVEVPLGRKAID